VERRPRASALLGNRTRHSRVSKLGSTGCCWFHSCGVRKSCLSMATRLSALFRSVLHINRQQPAVSRTIQQCGKHDDPQQNPEGQKHPHND